MTDISEKADIHDSHTTSTVRERATCVETGEHAGCQGIIRGALSRRSVRVALETKELFFPLEEKYLQYGHLQIPQSAVLTTPMFKTNWVLR